MICWNCEADLGEKGNFCPHCGMAIHRKKVCPQCNTKKEDDSVYCDTCGTLLKVYSLTGALLLRINGLNLFEGEKTIALPSHKGDLLIFDDRITFIGGQSPLSRGGFQKNPRPNPTEYSLPLDRIRFVRIEKKIGKPCLVLELENNRIVSLSSLTVDSATVTRAASIIDEYKLIQA